MVVLTTVYAEGGGGVSNSLLIKNKFYDIPLIEPLKSVLDTWLSKRVSFNIQIYVIHFMYSRNLYVLYS